MIVKTLVCHFIVLDGPPIPSSRLVTLNHEIIFKYFLLLRNILDIRPLWTEEPSIIFLPLSVHRLTRPREHHIDLYIDAVLKTCF